MSESNTNHHTEIIGHRISYFYRGDGAPTSLDESSVEHIKKLLKDDYREGELCYFDSASETEFRGWWSIEFPVGTSHESSPEDRYTEIYGHRIRYHYDGEGAPDTMDEASVEHVGQLLEQDFREGELSYYDSATDTQYSGWWNKED